MMIFTDQYSTLFSSVYLNCYWHMMETLSWKNTRQFFRRFPKPLKSHIVDYRGIVKTTALREKISCSELCSSSYMAFLRTAIPSKISCPLLRDKSSECSSSFSSMGRSVHFKWKKNPCFYRQVLSSCDCGYLCLDFNENRSDKQWRIHFETNSVPLILERSWTGVFYCLLLK